MAFEDDLDSLVASLPEGTDMTPYDNLRAAYTERVSVGDAKIQEVTQKNSELETANTGLRAQNYDLLMAQSRGNPPTPTSGATGGEPDEPAIPTLDDLITYQ